MTASLLSALYVYPVKSLRGRAAGEAAVEPWGITGDRRWMLVDAAGKCLTQREHPRLALVTAEPLPDGTLRLTAPGQEPLMVRVPEPVATRTVRIWDDKVEAVAAGPEADAWFSAYTGADTSLVHMDDPARRRPVDQDYGRPGETVGFADGFPLLVTTTGSLEALNSLIREGDHPGDGPLPMNRFRPNAVLDGTAPWAEDDWRRIRIGEVVLRVVKPCGRCVVTTTDQESARRGKEPLRTLAAHRRVNGRLVFGQNLVPENRGTLRIGDPLTVLE